jgi:hypothetical protein
MLYLDAGNVLSDWTLRTLIAIQTADGASAMSIMSLCSYLYGNDAHIMAVPAKY